MCPNMNIVLTLVCLLILSGCFNIHKHDDLDADGFSQFDGDCDDEDSTINPEAADETIDGTDQNCDQVDGINIDGDGHADIRVGGMIVMTVILK